MVTLTPCFGIDAILPSSKAKSSDTISALSTQAARFTSGTFAYDRPKLSGFDAPSARPAWMKTSHSGPKNLLPGKGAADFPRNKLHTSQTTDCMLTDYRLALSTVSIIHRPKFLQIPACLHLSCTATIPAVCE